MHLLLLVMGLFLLGSAWVLLFRSGIIFKINTWMRAHIFNDELVLFSGRRLAFLLCVLGGLALFSGVEGIIQIQPIKPRIAAMILVQANDEFRHGRYMRVISRCRDLVRADPKNVEAWQLLANAWWAVGEKDQARRAVLQILRIDPNFPLQTGPLAAIMEGVKLPENDDASADR